MKFIILGCSFVILICATGSCANDKDTDKGENTIKDSGMNADSGADMDSDMDMDADTDADGDTDMDADADAEDCLDPIPECTDDSDENCLSFNEYVDKRKQAKGGSAGSFECTANNELKVAAVWSGQIAPSQPPVMYYDRNSGLLVAIHEASDYLEFCDGTSHDKWYGFVIKTGCDEENHYILNEECFYDSIDASAGWSEEDCFDFQIDSIP